MTKKRKAEATGLDEPERTLYASFCTAANTISQFYTEAHNQQKLAFHAGERHCAERFCRWLRQQQNSRIAVEEILQFLQSELDTSSGDEMPMSPGHHSQHINLPSVLQQQPLIIANQTASDGLEHTSCGILSRGVPPDHTKVPAFSGLVSSPNRRPFPIIGVTQGGHTVLQYISGDFERQDESILEQHYGTLPNETHNFPNGTHNSHGQHYNSSIQGSHSVELSIYDPLETRPVRPFGEHDANTEMHTDGDPEA